MAMFEPQPSARADLRPGTLYAVAGEGGWIYYGQVMPDNLVGFFRRRDREIAAPEAVLAAPVMAQITMTRPSIGRAVRAGLWKRLGSFALHPGLVPPQPFVQWSVGTLIVRVFGGAEEDEYDTRVEDPLIQDYEIAAAWDAEYHLPARLTADYGAEPAEWHVGGPVWRERRVHEERARRFPGTPGNDLLEGWVPVLH